MAGGRGRSGAGRLGAQRDAAPAGLRASRLARRAARHPRRARCARPGSPKSARSGSTATTGCSAECSPGNPRARSLLTSPECWQTGMMSALPLSDQVTPAPGAALREPCVLLKLGEIVLKGRNRQQFERLLHDNIRRAVRDLGLRGADLAARGRHRAADRGARARGPGRRDAAVDLRCRAHAATSWAWPGSAGRCGWPRTRRRPWRPRCDAHRGPAGHLRGARPAPGQAVPAQLRPARRR